MQRSAQWAAMPARIHYARHNCGSVARAETPDRERKGPRAFMGYLQPKEAYYETAWEVVGREAVLSWLAAYRDYLAFVHAVTFCKKCAFLWDMKGAYLARW